LISARGVAAELDLIPADDVAVTGGRDFEDVVRERWRVWHDNAPTLLDFYRDRGLLMEIAGDRPIDEVGDSVMQAVGAPVGA